MTNSIESVIFGSDRETSFRYLLVAGLLFITTVIAFRVTAEIGVSMPFSDGSNHVFVLLTLFGLLVVQSYQNNGLLICIALATSIPLGVYLILASSSTTVPNVSIVWGIGVASVFGIGFGALGFITGLGIRKLMEL